MLCGLMETGVDGETIGKEKGGWFAGKEMSVWGLIGCGCGCGRWGRRRWSGKRR